MSQVSGCAQSVSRIHRLLAVTCMRPIYITSAKHSRSSSQCSTCRPLPSKDTRGGSFTESRLPHPNKASLYIHWPYCRRRCTYCNFNKYISQSVNEERMRKCLLKEMETLLDLSGVTCITSVFFGGGTPSLAAPETIASVLDLVRQSVTFSSEAEVTIEVNPTATETGKLRDFKLAGVNRLSIGVQSVDAGALTMLGRDHSAVEALRCLEQARALYGENVSADLMFGWPGHTLAGWMEELQQMLGVCGSHLSLYQLTLERGTALFKQVMEGKAKLPETDTVAAMYLEAVKTLQSHGFEHYEVSNFAKEGLYSSHNLSYWRGAQYLGVGPGAHGRFSVGQGCRQARVQTLEPDNWMWEVERHGHATRRSVPLSCADRMEELLYLGLRTKWGISNEMWEQINASCSMQDMFGHWPEVQSLIQQGLLQLDSRGLHATERGLAVLDSITVALLALLQAAASADST